MDTLDNVLVNRKGAKRSREKRSTTKARPTNSQIHKLSVATQVTFLPLGTQYYRWAQMATITATVTNPLF